jgi:hypothetical protein
MGLVPRGQARDARESVKHPGLNGALLLRKCAQHRQVCCETSYGALLCLFDCSITSSLEIIRFRCAGHRGIEANAVALRCLMHCCIGEHCAGINRGGYSRKCFPRSCVLGHCLSRDTSSRIYGFPLLILNRRITKGCL